MPHAGAAHGDMTAPMNDDCNITKVCPEHIIITDNAIIPLKERVVDEFYDPLTRLFRVFKGK
jgi:hypothetical protein